MASGLKGSIQPNANTDTTPILFTGSACVVNISACNYHASNTEPKEIYVVPSGQSKGIQSLLKKMLNLAGKGVIERTGIVMGVGDFIVVNYWKRNYII